MSVNLCWRQPHFIGIRYTRRQHSGEDVLKVIIIANYLQQRLAPGAVLADTKEIFCCGIQGLYQQIAVNYDDCRVETVEYGIPAWGLSAATSGFFLAGLAAA